MPPPDPEREARRAERPPIEVRVRDLDRIREKTPLYVEPRHLALAAGAVLAVLAAAFTGGWWLGRDVAPAGTPGPGTPVAAAPAAGAPGGDGDREDDGSAARRAVQGRVLPAPADLAPRSEEGGNAAVRREAEAAPEPPPAPEPPAPAPAPEPPATTEAPAPPAPPPAAVAVAATPAAPVAPEPPSPPVAQTPPPPAPEPVVPPPAPEPVVPPPAPEPPPPPAVAEPGDGFWPGVLVTDLDRCASCIVEDGACGPVDVPPPPVPAPPTVAIAAPPKAVAPAPAAPAAPRPAGASPYSVQARSYQDEAAAREYAAILTSRGYTARLVPHRDASNRTWYRVRLGRFPTLAAARAFATTFNRRENETAVPVEAP